LRSPHELVAVAGVVTYDVVTQDIVLAVVVVSAIDGTVDDIAAGTEPGAGAVVHKVVVEVVGIAADINTAGIGVPGLMHDVAGDGVERGVFFDVNAFADIPQLIS
jgi:hypothetical protein